MNGWPLSLKYAISLVTPLAINSVNLINPKLSHLRNTGQTDIRAQGRCLPKEPQRVQEGIPLIQTSLYEKPDHPTVAVLLSQGELMLRVGFQSRVVHTQYTGVVFQKICNLQAI